MADFKFLQNPVSNKWVISAPRRSHRTNVGKVAPVCPFCPGQEIAGEELYRVPGIKSIKGTTGITGNEKNKASDTQWRIRVVANKFPFAPNHEIIIHSPDHHKNWDELPNSAVELILKTYRERFSFHSRAGPHFVKTSRGKQVYIFHNSGSASGASLDHPHTQLVVIPAQVKLDITPLNMDIYKRPFGLFGPAFAKASAGKPSQKNILETEHFLVSCPQASEWPDEVWLSPKRQGAGFGSISDLEITDLSFGLSRIIQIFDSRHGHEFPYNFYIHPGKNWYLRLIPRIKVVGGFELGTNIIVNTQDPHETFAFIKEHFWEPDHAKIKSEHSAEYRKRV